VSEGIEIARVFDNSVGLSRRRSRVRVPSLPPSFCWRIPVFPRGFEWTERNPRTSAALAAFRPATLSEAYGIVLRVEGPTPAGRGRYHVARPLGQAQAQPTVSNGIKQTSRALVASSCRTPPVVINPRRLAINTARVWIARPVPYSVETAQAASPLVFGRALGLLFVQAPLHGVEKFEPAQMVCACRAPRDLFQWREPQRTRQGSGDLGGDGAGVEVTDKNIMR
jgi:hypothetical protein